MLGVTPDGEVHKVEIYERFKENLGKLQRNESQMTAEQKVKYKKPLLKLKHEIADDATEVMRNFLVSGIRLADEDRDSEDWKAVIRKSESFIDEWSKSGRMKEVSKVLFTTFDIDEFTLALLPLYYKIWYEAYGPYWLKHCLPTFEDEFTFSNDIIGMEWWEENQEWAAVKIEGKKKVCDYQRGVRIMLPPTDELLQEAYQKDLEGLS